MLKLQEITLAAAAISSALISGLFFAYTFSVNLGLHKLDNKGYLLAMQHINKEILNPTFYSCFVGALVLLIASSILYYDIHSPRFYLILCACISYTIGVFIITGAKNVPLNNQLAQFDLSTASETAIHTMRTSFEKPWVFWNNIRTICSFIALFCIIINLVFFKSKS